LIRRPLSGGTQGDQNGRKVLQAGGKVPEKLPEFVLGLFRCPRSSTLSSMPNTLTRRRDPGSREEAWLIFYGDMRVGAIGQRSGNPVGTDAWFWRCGFYPRSNPGDGTNGTASDFEAARAAFESAWSVFLSKRTEADFLEYRRHCASTAWKYAMQTADPNSRRPSALFLWRRDRDRRHGPAHLRRPLKNRAIPGPAQRWER
jgi:hypothetical protein